MILQPKDTSVFTLQKKYVDLVVRKLVCCMRTTKAQTSLRIQAVWSMPLLLSLERMIACYIQNFIILAGRERSGRVLDSRPRACGFEPHRRHCIVSLRKNINPCLVLVTPRKTSPFITEKLLMEVKNQINQKQIILASLCIWSGWFVPHLVANP